MREIIFNDTSAKAELGDTVNLQKQTGLEVVSCIETGVPMLNIDADQLAPGDLTFIKKLGLTISNPETEKAVALGVEYQTFGRKLADWFGTDSSSSSDDDDDSSFFSSSSDDDDSGSSFGGSSSFGGFGGGSFSGGGASGSF